MQLVPGAACGACNDRNHQHHFRAINRYTNTHVLNFSHTYVFPKCRPLLKPANGCAKALKHVKRGLRCKIIRIVKTPYHLQDVGSRIYICKGKHQHKRVGFHASCNFNTLKNRGNWGPGPVCPTGWGSIPSQSRAPSASTTRLRPREGSPPWLEGQPRGRGGPGSPRRPGHRREP